MGCANRRCECNDDNQIGIGDNTNSWGFDGSEAKKHNGGTSNFLFESNKFITADYLEPTDWGERWTKGDIVGVHLDLINRQLGFSLNGNFLGHAFDNLDGKYLISHNSNHQIHFFL